MELRHLRYFVAVAVEENISRAAVKLHVSQPGISRQIRDLEEEIGVPLFERGAKSLRLTVAGRVFLTESRAVLQHAADAVSRARASLAGVQGDLHLGYAPSLTVEMLPGMLRTFQGKCPRIRVSLHDLSTAEMVEQLRSGKLQVALTVRLAPKVSRGFDFVELARYPLRVAVALKHPLARHRTVRLAQLAPHPLIGYDRQDYPEYHRMVNQLFARVGARPQMIEEHDGVSGIILAVESGTGVALVPSCIQALVGDRLTLVPIAGVVSQVQVVAVWKKNPADEPTRQFIALARQTVITPVRDLKTENL